MFQNEKRALPLNRMDFTFTFVFLGVCVCACSVFARSTLAVVIVGRCFFYEQQSNTHQGVSIWFWFSLKQN